MPIINKRPLLNKLVADGEFKCAEVHPSYIVSVYVDGRLDGTIAQGEIHWPLSIWV